MLTDAFLRSTSLVPLDDAPMTTSAKFFDLEQYGTVNQADDPDQSFPIERFITLVVTVAFVECTSMAFQLVSDDAVTFDSHSISGPNKILTGTEQILVADLVVGKVIFNVAVPRILDRYVTFDNTKSGSTETTGEVELFLNTAPITALNIQKFPT